MKKVISSVPLVMLVLILTACSALKSPIFADKKSVAEQRSQLAKNTMGRGYGPQSPRNIDSPAGRNKVAFNKAPPYQQMNLCNIHFHKNAEHAGGQFNKYVGKGDGHGFETGYRYSGKLTKRERRPLPRAVCTDKHGGLQSGDTIELHYVHSSAQIYPGPGLGSCLSDAIQNPQLRVEAQVYVLVNDRNAANFRRLTYVDKKDGLYQAVNIPRQSGRPVVYSGSTTGPGYNEIGSPLQVTWSVRPKVVKVDIKTVGDWCEGNQFDEDHGHGVRNLVKNLDLLSPIL